MVKSNNASEMACRFVGIQQALQGMAAVIEQLIQSQQRPNEHPHPMMGPEVEQVTLAAEEHEGFGAAVDDPVQQQNIMGHNEERWSLERFKRFDPPAFDGTPSPMVDE
ncbi:hypothetical protein Droror1_Dr00008513 [Drosera rotundifolia]